MKKQRRNATIERHIEESEDYLKEISVARRETTEEKTRSPCEPKQKRGVLNSVSVTTYKGNMNCEMTKTVKLKPRLSSIEMTRMPLSCVSIIILPYVP